jgi:glyoxylase I family protein
MSQNGGAGIQTGGVHHARLTVADPARSREFYTDLLGFDVLMDFPDGFLLNNGSMLLGIRTAPDANKAAAGDRFDPQPCWTGPPVAHRWEPR